MKQKKLWIIIAVAAVLVVGLTAGILAIVLGGGEEAYRTVKVYEVNGTVEIYRGQGDAIAAYQNMLLENMDSVKTLADSYLYVKLDDDKYLMAMPNSAFSLEATGSAQNSKTKIVIESGEVFVHVTNPLSDSSEFSVGTGNSTMAIRGTSFSVSYDGEQTVYQAFDGELAITPVDQNGNVAGEPVQLQENTGITVTTNQEAVEVSPTQQIDYGAMDDAELEFLQFGIEQGNEMDGIDASEIESMLGTEQPTTEEPTTEEPTTEEPTTEEPTTEEPTTEEPTTEEPTTEQPTTEEPTTEPPEVPVYKVVFMGNGGIYAVQMVKEGERAVRPFLKPDPFGSWDWDFEQPITEDTVIYWTINFE